MLKYVLFFSLMKEEDYLLPFEGPGYIVLDKNGLENIAEHKYVSGIYTPLDNILDPWWFWLTYKLPLWLAPNLVTLTGFLPMMACYGLAWYYSPDFDTPPPRWLYFLMSFSLFFYQTMDAMDGKQARRTKESTPLGQLFDHGCDCLACLSHHSMAAVFVLSGGTTWTLWGMAVLQTSFFMAQWQEHYTGILCTSTCNNTIGVTETQYGLIFLMAFSGIIGPDALKGIMHTVVVTIGEQEFTTGTLVILGWIFFNIFLISLCLHQTLPFVHPTKPAATVYEKLKDLLPIVLLNMFLLFGWDQTVVNGCTRVLCLCAGVLFFFYTAQMIIYSMAEGKFPLGQYTLGPFAALAIASNVAYLPFEMLAVKFTLMVFTAAVIFHVLTWLFSVIFQIKGRLGINVFTIKSREAAKEN